MSETCLGTRVWKEVIRRLPKRSELPKEEVNHGKGGLASVFHPAPWTEFEAQWLGREEGQKVMGAVQEKPRMTVHSRVVWASQWQMAEPGTFRDQEDWKHGAFGVSPLTRILSPLDGK